MHALIALGANLGDRVGTIHAAISAISAQVGKVIARSPLYETKALTLPGTDSDMAPPFLNAALCCETELLPQEVLQRLLAIEVRLGRVRGERWAARTIDLDLLAMDAIVLTGPTLTLPHPELAKRDFVLVPLIDIAADWRHPLLNKTPTQLLAQLKSQHAELYVKGVFEHANSSQNQ